VSQARTGLRSCYLDLARSSPRIGAPLTKDFRYPNGGVNRLAQSTSFSRLIASGLRFQIKRVFPGYQTDICWGRGVTHPHRFTVEVDEVTNADQADWHSSAAHRTCLIAWRLVNSHKHLQGPATAHRAWGWYRRCAAASPAINLWFEARHCGPSRRCWMGFMVIPLCSVSQ
jgi:hypothetical protein